MKVNVAFMPPAIDPLLLDFPDHFETERLHIRAPRPGDGPTVYEAVCESYPQLRAWMPWARSLQTPDETEMFARRAAANFILRQTLGLLLFRKSDGRFIGSSGLHTIDWDVPRFELGYWIRTSESGKGYMTEAVNGITAFAFDVLLAERVEIRCDARNTRSAAVAERAGYTLEARLRSESRDNAGGLRDTLIYGMVRADYLERTQAPSGDVVTKPPTSSLR